MGSKKHKKHKSERREKYEERLFSLEDRPPGLKLILKVGSEHGSDSPAYGISENGGILMGDYHERHKKSKKKKKKKDREKKHKHHHKEKRRHREDSSQEDMSVGEDTQFQENMLRYSNITTASSLSSMPVTKPMIPLKSPDLQISKDDLDNMQHEQSLKMNEMKMMTPSSSSESAREPRTCVLKLKQSKSPLAKLLDHLLRSLEKRDPHQFFAWPVTDDIAPGYSSIIMKPIDFSTMKQKIDDNIYGTLQEFSDDFKLMCDNAIKYNHVETVYHKAAKRLLHVGARLLQPENLMRSLRPLMNYMRELTSKELGFELPSSENQYNDGQNIDSGDEGLSTGAEEGTSSQAEDDEKRKLRLDNHPKTRYEPFIDDMTPDEILAQAQNAARNVRNRVTTKNKAHKMGFLRQNKDGTTSMKILLDVANDTPERLISLGAFTGKLQQGTGQLQTFREDRRNVAKIVKPLNYGAFSSFAPVYDSRFSNLTKEETELVFFTYGDENAANYAESIMEFTKDSLYASTLANGLLDILTSGEHRKAMATLTESQRQKYEEKEVQQSFPDCKEDAEKYENVNIDFSGLKSLSNLGMDVDFLENLEKDIKLVEIQKKLQSQLDVNCTLIEKLHQVQHERLSQPLPAHLSHVAKPNSDEIQLAAQLTSNLTEMAKQLAPGAITSSQSLRKAMGMSNVGLEPFVPQRMSLNDTQPIPSTNLQQTTANDVDIDTTSVDMDLEPETLVHHHHHHHHHHHQIQTTNVENTGSVDIESELREFLESGNSTVEHDTASIEQMLLN